MEKPYPSWIWNEEYEEYLAPLPYPDETYLFVWNEDTLQWINTGRPHYDPTSQKFN